MHSARSCEALISGGFTGTLDLGAEMLESARTRRKPTLFLAKLDGEGRVGWSRRYGDGEEASLTPMEFDGAGHALVAGSAIGSIDLGAGVMPSTGRLDIVRAKLGMLPGASGEGKAAL